MRWIKVPAIEIVGWRQDQHATVWFFHATHNKRRKAMNKWLISASLLAMALKIYAESNVPRPPEGVQYRPETLVQLGVKDLDRAIRFYSEMLGFVVTERRDDLKFAHLATNVAGLQIGL